MYHMDRRMQARHVYSLFQSLRKAAIVLQVSHSTVARWLKDPSRKLYTRTIHTKTEHVIDTIRIVIRCDPFVTLAKRRIRIAELFGICVSKELIRIAIKRNLRYSRKKAKYFSSPANLKQKTAEFLLKRDQLVLENRQLFLLMRLRLDKMGLKPADIHRLVVNSSSREKPLV